MNSTSVTGNVTKNPEIRNLNDGTSTTTFGIAVNRRTPDGSGGWNEVTSFFDVVCWRKQAENVAQSIRKGDRVIVTGRLDQRSWDTDSGEKRSRVEIVADEVGLSLLFDPASTNKQPAQQSSNFSNTEPF